MGGGSGIADPMAPTFAVFLLRRRTQQQAGPLPAGSARRTGAGGGARHGGARRRASPQKRQLGESLSGLDLLALDNQDLADSIAIGVEVYDRLGAQHNVTGDADRRGEAVAAGLHHEDRCAGRRLRMRRCACQRDGQWAKGKRRQREVHRSMSRVAHRGRGRGLLIRDVDDLHAAVLAAEGMLDILELGLAVADGH